MVHTPLDGAERWLGEFSRRSHYEIHLIVATWILWRDPNALHEFSEARIGAQIVKPSINFESSHY